MSLSVCGGWTSPFRLLLASPSFLETRSVARLKVYVLWRKKGVCSCHEDIGKQLVRIWSCMCAGTHATGRAGEVSAEDKTHQCVRGARHSVRSKSRLSVVTVVTMAAGHGLSRVPSTFGVLTPSTSEMGSLKR